MLLHKKMVVFSTLLLVASSLSAAEKQKQNLLQLYNNLVAKQGLNTNGIVYEANQKFICGGGEKPQILMDYLNDVQTVGLIKVFRRILIMRPQGFNASMFNEICLKTIAYQQNKYGNGQPYIFTGIDAQAQNQGDIPFLKTYMNSEGETINITRYSFFYGMLNNIDTVKNMDLTPWERGIFDVNIKTLKLNLENAIKEAGQ